MKNLFLVIFFLFLFQINNAQKNVSVSSYDQKQYEWDAYWIKNPGASTSEYGVYHFRRIFNLDSIGDDFRIKISADNRYKLYVNERFVCLGPARGDVYHWRFENIDINKYLKKGANVIAVLVWNAGEYKPVAQFSYQTGFILEGVGEKEQFLNTGTGKWKVIENNSYSPISPEALGYCVIGATDKLDAEKFPWGWKQYKFDDKNWNKPTKITSGRDRGYLYAGNWQMIERKIPLMVHKKEKPFVIRRAKGLDVKTGLYDFAKPIVIPSNTDVSLLFDQRYLTIGYPRLTFSKGDGSTIKITYAEALYDEEKMKGNRNIINNKEIIGYYDFLISDGGEKRVFEPLWNRTWRYVQVDVQTKGEPLDIDDFTSYFSAYPFNRIADFKSENENLSRIFDVGWRTARLCAGETYFDCPYYEQLNYVGDTRIQALISLYMTGDNRLMRKAIRDFDHSRISDGLTQSRYPSHERQIIPPYSLYWVKMIHDFYLHVDDKDFVEQYLNGINTVLTWFENRIGENGMVSINKWWCFVDWTPYYYRGIPHGGDGGYSSIISLQFVDALQSAAYIFSEFNRQYESVKYTYMADMVREAVLKQCYDSRTKLFAQTPEKKVFSQHANVMAILTDVVGEKDQVRIMKNVLNNDSLIKCSIYYKFYLFNALKKTGLADQYLDNINEWHDMLDRGLTTFSEKLNNPRSDCHAWSASPCYNFLSTVAGIQSGSQGFKTVMIEPYPGELKKIEAYMPHPQGEIKIEMKRRGKDGIVGDINIPENTTGMFIWNGKEIKLNGGEQKVFVK